MPALLQTQEYVKNELPYEILMSLYKNSRASLRELGRDLGISYHTINTTLKELEKKYKIEYTLEIDASRLGFTESRIITIKFGTMPDINYLKTRITKDIFIQNAYLAEGEFDLLLHIVGIGEKDFQSWQWSLRMDLSNYKPSFKFCTVSDWMVGFLPLREELIRQTSVLSKTEINVLVLLNLDSRIRIKEISKKLRLPPSRIVYIIKKLRNDYIYIQLFRHLFDF